MRFWLILQPRSVRRRDKYQSKIAKAQWKDMKAERKDQRGVAALERDERREQITSARAARVNAALSGQGDHSMPWWREPTLASLIGRRRAHHEEQ